MAITSPLAIPGLVLWYSADAETGYADNASMTQWTDQSGLGNHGTIVGAPKWRSSLGAAGGPAVQPSGGNYFNVPPSVCAGLASGEWFISLRATTATNMPAWFGNSGGQSHYNYGGTQIYDDFGSTVRKGAITPGVDMTQWRRYNSSSAAGNWRAYLDGALIYSTTSNAVGWTSTPRIGVNSAGGSFTGYMGAVLFFNRQLTTAERTDVDTWLAGYPSGGNGLNVNPKWYDGTTLLTAKTVGRYTGTGVASTRIKGWWDGSSIQPLT